MHAYMFQPFKVLHTFQQMLNKAPWISRRSFLTTSDFNTNKLSSFSAGICYFWADGSMWRSYGCFIQLFEQAPWLWEAWVIVGKWGTVFFFWRGGEGKISYRFLALQCWHQPMPQITISALTSINWCFGARWFGIRGTPSFHKGIPGIQTTGPQTTNPNH